jgi:hypothetical protein
MVRRHLWSILIHFGRLFEIFRSYSPVNSLLPSTHQSRHARLPLLQSSQRYLWIFSVFVLRDHRSRFLLGHFLWFLPWDHQSVGRSHHYSCKRFVCGTFRALEGYRHRIYNTCKAPYEFFRNMTSFAIDHFSWVLVLVFIIYVLIPRIHHVTTEELKEEIERRDRATALNQARQEVMIKEIRESFSFNFWATYTGQESHLV